MFGDNPKHCNTIARIVNRQHLFRLKKLFTNPKVKEESVIYGGSVDEENLY